MSKPCGGHEALAAEVRRLLLARQSAGDTVGTAMSGRACLDIELSVSGTLVRVKCFWNQNYFVVITAGQRGDGRKYVLDLQRYEESEQRRAAAAALDWASGF